MDRRWFSSPPMLPTVLPIVPELAPPEPIGTRRCMLGTLNVVEPSPPPQIVPSTPNKVAKVARDTADPSHSRYPDGATVPANGNSAPVGTVAAPEVLGSQSPLAATQVRLCPSVGAVPATGRPCSPITVGLG